MAGLLGALLTWSRDCRRPSNTAGTVNAGTDLIHSFPLRCARGWRTQSVFANLGTSSTVLSHPNYIELPDRPGALMLPLLTARGVASALIAQFVLLVVLVVRSHYLSDKDRRLTPIELRR